MSEEQYVFGRDLSHEGVARRSGRYPWGSGKTPNQRNKSLLNYVDDLQKKGMSEAAIAKGMGMSTTQLRAKQSIAKNAIKAADISEAERLKAKGMSNVAIGERMGKNESVVRDLLNPATKERNTVLDTTVNLLRDQLKENKYLDIGEGVENQLGISETALKTAVAVLKEEGYSLHHINIEQQGTGRTTTGKVLGPPDVHTREVYKELDQIKTISGYSEDHGRTVLGIEPPKNVDSSRIGVRYAKDGGADKDGVIELRRGVEDLSLGSANYAQVRIAVDGTHFLKGMAMYSDNMPAGVDMLFNTIKSDTGNKLDAMKGLKDDEDNPFGSTIRQKHYTDSNGKRQLSPLNIVGGNESSGEEGGWYGWSHNLSSQMLSKQSPRLAKQQLDLTYNIKKEDLDEIMSLTNPIVKKNLLQSYAEGADSSAKHLQAAGLPRTRNHVLLPIPSMKDNEIYAPNYRDGEKVVLIRHPHGGTFEIPELTVNNRNKEAKSLMGQAKDAVGINPKVAQRLSGADFDGDTVLVIPNNGKSVATTPSLKQLKNFDPQTAYPKYDGMKPMTARAKGIAMGDVSNLITDMTIRGANMDEIARAVRHSMVVIDAEKHKLNYKQSALDHGIKELKTKYQGSARSGASTLISQASSEQRVDDRKPRSAKDGGGIDRETGKKVFTPTGETYVDKNGKVVTSKTSSYKMAEVDDARKLSSGTPMETVYANHANRLKALANQARKEMIRIAPPKQSPSAKAAYSKEVATLNAKLNIALKNKPIERQAQLLAGTVVSAKRRDNPGLSNDDLKKIRGAALREARTRTGSKKTPIAITPREWDAIQAGAISANKLQKIIQNSDLDKLKQMAMPRVSPVMSSGKMARAKTMMTNGYTPSEIADALGIAVSTLNSALE